MSNPKREDMKKILGFGAVALGLLVPALGLAGFKQGQSVVIVDNADSTGFANADMASAHNSADSVQYIGCTVYGSTGGTSVSCIARALDGRSRSCFTTNANMIQAAANIDSDGYLIFYWNAAGQCTSISAANGSYLHPKH
jgi:hypothetical protein